MSSLKRLRQQRELERMQALAAEQDDASGDDSGDGDEQEVGGFAGFDMLEDEDEEVEEEEEEEKDEDKDEDAELANEPEEVEEDQEEQETDEDTTEASTERQKAGKNRSRKKKKKNKKKQRKPKNKETDSEDKKTAEESLDDILQDFRTDATPHTVTMAAEQKRNASLLATSNTSFDPEIEVKRTFGSNVLRMAQREDELEQGGLGRRRGRREDRNRTEMARSRSRRAVLCRFMPDWPDQNGGGLKMDLVGEEAGVLTFRFEYPPEFERVEREYDAVTASYNPQAIAYFLRQHPYHVRALLQMSQIYLHHGEAKSAVSLLERCLYTYERAFHPRFKFTQGHCRLDPEHPPNKGLFQVLSKYSRHLGKRRCTRTALEFCKLMLSLAPQEDPMSGVLLIDFLALRCRAHGFLEALVDGFSPPDGVPFLSMLPNMAFNCALSKFLTRGKQRLSATGPEPRLSVKGTSSSDHLAWALCMFPEVLQALVVGADEKALKKPRWVRLFSDPHFAQGQARLNSNSYIKKLVTVFVERSAMLWKPDSVLDWVEEVAKHVVELQNGAKVDMKAFGSLHSRTYAENAMPLKYKTLVPSDYSDAAVEPLPEDAGQPQRRVLPQELLDMYENIDLSGANPMMVFLRTLLPWVHAAEDDLGGQWMGE